MALPAASPLPLSGSSGIDVSLNGYYWQLGSDRTVRWSLSNGFAGEYWLSASTAVAQLTQVFASFSHYADIKFEYAGYFASPVAAAPNADINIAFDGGGTRFTSTNSWASGYFPGTAYNTYYTGSAGDIFVNLKSAANSLPSYAPGSAGYFLFLHEIGHTLGLKHPHDNGGTGRPTLTQLGLAEWDEDWFSVMSYNDEFNLNQRSWDPATPMMLDVLGLQYLYGPNLTTNAADSVHTLALTSAYQTIWDASGRDVIDVSGSTIGWTIELPNRQLSSLLATKQGQAVPSGGVMGGQNTFYWLTGDIEDARGSVYGDTIRGTDAANNIRGNGGNDLLYGLGGNDHFHGLSGTDAVYGGIGFDTFNVERTAASTTGAKLRDGTVLLRGSAGELVLARDVERVSFTDITVDVANMPIIGNENSALVALYVAAFRRAPETGGYNYWHELVATRGIVSVADTIFSLDSVKALYPSAMSSSQFVTTIYQNLFNKLPDAEGLAYWTAQLTNASRGRLVLDMSNVALSVPDGTFGKDFFQDRVDWSLYAVHYQANKGIELSPAHLTSLTNGITENVYSVISLIAQAESGVLI